MKRVIGKIDPTDKHVSIWGAGFAGLVLGHYLKEQGYKVTIFEAASKVGGKIETKKTKSGLVEKGPNALYMNADSMDLLKELRLEPIPVTKKLKRLLFIKGRPRRPLPFTFIFKMLMSGGKRPPLISDGLSVADFFRPLIGNDKIQNVLSPILGGVYAAEAETLHFKSVFDESSQVAQFNSYWDFLKLTIKNRRKQPRLDVSGSVSFEGGMQSLINKLADSLKKDIKLNCKESFKIKGNTIICTDALNASKLVKDVRPSLSAELKRIRYQELTTVTVFLKREIKSLARSFGVLVPLTSGMNSIGVINNKAAFPENNPNIFSYTFISRKKINKDEIISDIKRLAPDLSDDDIDDLDLTYWEQGLPLYDLQRYLSVKKLHQLARTEENLAFFGNYAAGISLREMVSAARSFATNPLQYSEIN